LTDAGGVGVGGHQVYAVETVQTITRSTPGQQLLFPGQTQALPLNTQPTQQFNATTGGSHASNVVSSFEIPLSNFVIPPKF